MSGPTSVPPGKESVWDYPRPPRLETTTRHLVVHLAGEVIADTRRGFRVLETGHPPTYYFPPEDVRRELLMPSQHHSFCEFKGMARYWSLELAGRRSENAAWSYPEPTPDYVQIQDYLAFYPSRVDTCYVDDEPVQAQEGDFYGGWITADIVGPFKGGPGTAGA